MKTNRFLIILNNRYFVKIWISQILSVVSAASLSFILIGKIFNQTQSSIAVGFYLFAYYLPTAILGPFVGVLIDMWNKKAILIYSNLIQSVLVLLYLTATNKIWPLYFFSFLYSLGDEFYNPTVGAAIPSLVKKQDLPTANSMFFITNQGAIIAGTFIGGVLLKILPSWQLTYPLISLSLLFSTFMLVGVPSLVLGKNNQKSFNWRDWSGFTNNLNLKSYWDKVREGYLFIQNTPLVMFPIFLLALLQVLVGVALIILPSLAQLIKLNYADSSFLIILPACLGALTGSWFLSRNSGHIRKNIQIFRGLSIMGLIIILIPLGQLLTFRPTFLGLLFGFGLGLGYINVYIPLQTLIQEHTPFKVRGRVFATLSTAITLASALPIFLTTTLVDIIGIRLVLLMLGGIICALSYIGWRRQNLILNYNHNHGI